MPLRAIRPIVPVPGVRVPDRDLYSLMHVLRPAFAADGRTVQEVAVIMDRDTGRPRGFATVRSRPQTFRSRQSSDVGRQPRLIL